VAAPQPAALRYVVYGVITETGHHFKTKKVRELSSDKVSGVQNIADNQY
jgi:hypothetical protein